MKVLSVLHDSVPGDNVRWKHIALFLLSRFLLKFIYFFLTFLSTRKAKMKVLYVLHDSVPGDNVFIENAVDRHAVVETV